jgi:hypothetical protein
MALVPGWGGLDYTQRIQMVQAGKADMQGNDLAQPMPQNPNLQGAGAGSSITRDPAGHEMTTVTPNLLPQQNDFEQSQMRLKAQLDAEAARQRAQLAAEAEGRRMGSISSLISTSNGTAAPHVGGVAPGVDEAQARATAFAHAKEQAGQTAMASVKAIEDAMASSGMTGSTVEAAGKGEAINGARMGVNDFTREQLMQDLARAAAVTDRNYAGDIQQRGQDMSMRQSILGLLNASGVAY